MSLKWVHDSRKPLIPDHCSHVSVILELQYWY